MRITRIKTGAKQLTLTLLTGLLLLTTPGTVLADEASPVSITTEALVEKLVLNAGQQEVQRVPATEVLPGVTVVFVNTVTNTSDSPAKNIIVANPIPENMVYQEGSASAKNAALAFSVDGGQNYDIPGKLMVIGEDGKPRRAAAADFTHIRWQLLTPLAPQGNQQVEFQAKVK